MKLSLVGTLNQIVAQNEALKKGESRVSDQSRFSIPRVKRTQDYATFIGSNSNWGYGSLMNQSTSYLGSINERIESVNDFFITKWLHQSQSAVYNKLKSSPYFDTDFLINQKINKII